MANRRKRCAWLPVLAVMVFASAAASAARADLAAAQDVAAAAGPGTVSGGPGVSDSVVAHTRELVADAIDRVGRRLEVSAPAPFAVTVHASLAAAPARVREHLHEGTAGVALPGTAEVHLLLDQMRLFPPHDLRTVVLHEVVHILLDQSVGPAGPYVPRWFHEGVAQCLSGSTYLGASEEDIVFLAYNGRLRSFSAMAERFPTIDYELRRAYAQSFSFVSYLIDELGLHELLAVARGCGPGRDFQAAFLAHIGVALAEYEEQWTRYLKTGSGAALRVLLTSCFGLTLVAALPLLVMAARRHWQRDSAAREKLQREEEQAPPGATG